MKTVRRTSSRLNLCAVCFAVVAPLAAAAYDPQWSRSQCAEYSANGLKERYVYGGNKGWINNDVWDDPSVEGVDCASYVCRCLALPEYVAENKAAPYPYTTDKLYAGVPNTVQVDSINNLKQWDLWVYISGGSKHTGLFKQYSGSYIITREARSATSGIVEGKFSKQYLIDRGARYWRRANWASLVQLPVVQTSAASKITAASAVLNGLIVDDGGGTIDQYGFSWGTTEACSNGWLSAGDLSENGFSAALSGLSYSSVYYFKARVHNSAGWAEGSVLSFRTDVNPNSPAVIVDNGSAGTASTGTWGVSGAPDPYGADSLWARDGATYSWSFTPPSPGFYDVSMWWTQMSSRSDAVPVQIQYSDGISETTVNQQTQGGQWNWLGQFYFDSVGTVTLTALGSYPVSTCADAVRFALLKTNQRPKAQILSVSPQILETGRYITFSGQGIDDGTISAYEWTSSLDGVFGKGPTVLISTLSEGTHTITLRVCDDMGIWSLPAEQTITIVPPAGEVIVDNGDAGTSFTGTWGISGAADPYGPDSLWARGGATYSWSFTPPSPGFYDVSMWWTQLSSRSNAVPVQIDHSDGVFETTVNQQTQGGQWNSLGQFYFDSLGTVTLTALGSYPVSSCADAVRFTLLQTNLRPTAEILSILPQSPQVGQPVVLSGRGIDDGQIAAFEWTSSLDGLLGTAASVTVPGLSEGTHTLSLRVCDEHGIWSEPVEQTLVVGAAAEEIIIDNGDAGTFSTGTWGISGGLNPYGADSLWARYNSTYTWTFQPQQGGLYEVYLWWTEFSSRGASIPVSIVHRDGTTSLLVNQQTGGGEWNWLGTFPLEAGKTYSVTLSTPNDNSTACADAVRIIRQ